MIIDKYNDFRFNMWFNGSKVVDNDNKPLVVYHGTYSDDKFDYFDGTRGVAWFTPNYDYANNYTHGDGFVMMFYLSIKNPYILTISPQEEMSLSDFISYTGIPIKKKYYGKKYDNEVRSVYDWYDPTYTTFLDELTLLHYDGMKTTEYDKFDCWLVFDNVQIFKISDN